MKTIILAAALTLGLSPAKAQTAPPPMAEATHQHGCDRPDHDQRQRGCTMDQTAMHEEQFEDPARRAQPMRPGHADQLPPKLESEPPPPPELERR